MLPVSFKGSNRVTTRLHRTTRTAKLPALCTSLIIAILGLTLLLKLSNHSISQFISLKVPTFDPSIRLNPTLELTPDAELIWQIPTSPKAVLFLAHGCNGKASNFWDKSPACPNCLGLPEERAIVLHALSREFAVLAISSKNACWNLGEERLTARDSIKKWLANHKLEKLPAFALGASSGGYFVSVLAKEMTFKAIALMIAEGVFSHLDIDGTYPPTLFVHMPKDERRKNRIEKYAVVMREKGIRVDEIRCDEFPLTPRLLAERVPGLGSGLSAELFEVFRERGFVDENGYMRDDGRVIPWKNAVEEKGIRIPSEAMVNYIQEEMNLAYGYHEMTSVKSREIFDWFESNM